MSRSCTCLHPTLRFHTLCNSLQGDDIACEVCGDAADGAGMLLCDGCDLGFHMRCLSPPLAAIPAGSWHCRACAGNNGEDGMQAVPAPTLGLWLNPDRHLMACFCHGIMRTVLMKQFVLTVTSCSWLDTMLQHTCARDADCDCGLPRYLAVQALQHCIHLSVDKFGVVVRMLASIRPAHGALLCRFCYWSGGFGN